MELRACRKVTALKNVITQCRQRHGIILHLLLLITCLESLLLLHNVICLAQRMPESVPIFDDSDPIPPRPINVSTFNQLQPPSLEVAPPNDKVHFDDISGSGAGGIAEEIVHEEPSPTVAPSITETSTGPELAFERAAHGVLSEVSNEPTPTTMSSAPPFWPVESCSNDGDCPSNSTCVAEACICQSGYCLNEGSCLVNNVPEVICLCKDGFSGPHCQFKDQLCGGRFCLNGGSCSANGTHCICTSGKYLRL